MAMKWKYLVSRSAHRDVWHAGGGRLGWIKCTLSFVVMSVRKRSARKKERKPEVDATVEASQTSQTSALHTSNHMC